MKALVVGLGSIGMRHARNLKRLGVDSVIGCDPSPERQQQFSSEIGGQAFDDEDTGLAEKPDLALICSPNRFHVFQATKAARVGCALFIEKPLGTDLAETEAFARLVDERSLYVHIGSNWKFHPAFIRMNEWISAGRIGHVTGVQVLAGQWLPDWHPWEDFRLSYSARRDLGGGAIFDTHELDYLIWLLGPIDQFIGFKTQSGALPIETEDVAIAMLRFRSGALATILTDYIQRESRRRYHISGSEGTIEWDLRQGGVKLFEPGKSEPEVFDTAGAVDLNEMYLEQARRVLKDVKEGGPPVTPLYHMLQVLRLQLAWHQQRLSSAGTSTSW